MKQFFNLFIYLEHTYPLITTTVGQDGEDVSLDDVHLSIPPHSLKEEVNIKITLEDPQIPYNSLLRDSGIDTDDVKIKHIIKLEPSGVVLDPAASIQVSNFPGGNYLFVLHGTRDVDGFIEWEDVTDDVLASQPDSGGAGKIRLLIKAFCHRQIKIQYCRKNHRFFKLQIPNPFVCFLQTNSGLPTTL